MIHGFTPHELAHINPTHLQQRGQGYYTGGRSEEGQLKGIFGSQRANFGRSWEGGLGKLSEVKTSSFDPG